ncbi:uncharacterized protein LOC141492755 [Macrotis lagotis]|uniref:uncharacterized protein LOC141492755 n=1 Tax=Macrotis lagotis TaxID=92651 RepID=UPI003D69E04B
MRLWLLSLVAGIILEVAGTPLGKVSTGTEQAEEEKEGQTDPYKESMVTLNLSTTSLLQLLNLSQAMNRSSEMDFIHRNLTSSIFRNLCEGCCKEKNKNEPNLVRISTKTLKNYKKKRPGQWTILARTTSQLGNSSINMVVMRFPNDTHIGYQVKNISQNYGHRSLSVKDEDLKGGWCTGCCENDEILERREEEDREVLPAWT